MDSSQRSWPFHQVRLRLDGQRFVAEKVGGGYLIVTKLNRSADAGHLWFMMRTRSIEGAYEAGWGYLLLVDLVLSLLWYEGLPFEHVDGDCLLVVRLDLDVVTSRHIWAVDPHWAYILLYLALIWLPWNSICKNFEGGFTSYALKLIGCSRVIGD